jgi:hypothetical protein
MTKDGLRGKGLNRKGTERISQRNAKLPNRRGAYLVTRPRSHMKRKFLSRSFR